MNVRTVVDYIENHLAGDVSLGALARRERVSPYHLHRAFHTAVGEPPHRYVRRLRLELAATRLKLSGRTVTDIAFGVGYATHEGFTRAFRTHFGMTPTRFRASVSPLHLPQRFAPRIERLPARRIALVRYVGPYDRTSEVFDRLASWGARRGARCDSMLAFYWDDQDITAAEKTRCQVAIAVGEDITGAGEISVRDFAAGEYAVLDHSGDVPERRSFYEAAFRTWLPAIGRRPAGAPPFEEYAVTARGLDQRSARIHIPLRRR